MLARPLAVTFSFAFVFACVFPFGAGGHESPRHAIEALTRRIAERGPTAPLLVRRASEFRAARDYQAAEKDLEAALLLDFESLEARLSLARVRLRRGDPAGALETAQAALRTDPDDRTRAALLALRAEVRLASDEETKALADFDRALELNPMEIDLYLSRSRAQARIGLHDARLKGLEAGIAATGSGLLRIEWIDALLDAGRYDEAAPHIEKKLARVRHKNSWRIRRARVLGARGEKEAADAELREAVEEINQRLNVQRPDFTLIADRGFAYALLNEPALAHKDLKAIRDSDAEPWIAEDLGRLISSYH